MRNVGSMRELLCFASETISMDSEISQKMSISKDLWPVFHDPFKMGTVFRNVINNAVEAMPDGGELTISAENLRFEQHPDRVPNVQLKNG